LLIFQLSLLRLIELLLSVLEYHNSKDGINYTSKKNKSFVILSLSSNMKTSSWKLDVFKARTITLFCLKSGSFSLRSHLNNTCHSRGGAEIWQSVTSAFYAFLKSNFNAFGRKKDMLERNQCFKNKSRMYLVFLWTICNSKIRNNLSLQMQYNTKYISCKV